MKKDEPLIFEAGMTIEIVLFSSGLSYRQKLIELKKRKIQEKLIIQLRKNQELQEKVNRELEEKVKERTVEIENQKEEIETQRDELWDKSVLLIKQGEELENQNRKISQQRDLLIHQKKEITDSIQYARKIQTAILPPKKILDSIFPSRFILFKPRDIVSGDFYWVKQIENRSYLFVADCSGHGVPGAFMSVLGISLLNEIIPKNHHLKANEILNILCKEVINALHQIDKECDTRDGMDIALCIIDNKTLEIQFSGAFHPLILMNDKGLTEIKGDRKPIGIHRFDESSVFTNHNIQLIKMI